MARKRGLWRRVVDARMSNQNVVLMMNCCESEQRMMVSAGPPPACSTFQTQSAATERNSCHAPRPPRKRNAETTNSPAIASPSVYPAAADVRRFVHIRLYVLL